jgi:hypothetical protein
LPFYEKTRKNLTANSANKMRKGRKNKFNYSLIQPALGTGAISFFDSPFRLSKKDIAKSPTRQLAGNALQKGGQAQ